jgi:ABC-type multidrug transport system fused ATPase/permease subunit
MGATMGFLAYFASNKLHHEALQNVFYSPMSVFETQPLGRILGIFGKDIDTIDNQLADSWRMLSMTLVSVSCAWSVKGARLADCQLIGSVVIITVFFHYFIAV